jgi:hypothetical protein
MGYVLNRPTYVMPTPAGAYRAAAAPAEGRLPSLVTALFGQPESPLLAESTVSRWCDIADPQEALEFVWRLQELGWIQALETPRSVPTGPIEDVLAELVPALTRGGKSLLADAHGFYLYSRGFPHEVAEELSALSADLASLHQRRSRSLNANLGMSGGAWGLVDAAGQSQLGFWPLFAGKQRFVLVVAGTPTFNRPELVDLIWVLHQRYAAPNLAIPS